MFYADKRPLKMHYQTATVCQYNNECQLHCVVSEPVMPSTFIALFYDDKNDNSNFSYIDTHDIRQNLSIDTQIF